MTNTGDLRYLLGTMVDELREIAKSMEFERHCGESEMYELGTANSLNEMAKKLEKEAVPVIEEIERITARAIDVLQEIEK